MDTRVRPQVVGRSAPGFDLRAWSDTHLETVEQALSNWVVVDAPAGLGDAMRYAVLDGGKRLRPLLVLAACEAVHGDAPAALRAACAASQAASTSSGRSRLPPSS